MGPCAACGQPLPPAARFCPQCAAPVEAAGSRPEERKVATVLFADLVGSTALADEQDPERTRIFLSRFYDAMAEEIANGGGTLDKFLGDGVLAAFGAPLAVEDHAERAVRSALAMRERVHGLFGPTVALRVGVNTGELIVGDDRRTGSLLTGDAVNVAARLEQAAASNEILVGERTVRACRDGFVFTPGRAVPLKGKSAAVICRALLGAAAPVPPRRTVVGRDRELGVLQEALTAVARSGTPRIVTLLGDPGIGKSAIVEEFARAVRGPPDATPVHVGRCRPLGRGTPFPALGDIVRAHLGIGADAPPEAVAGQLGKRWALGLPLGLEPPDGVHPLAVQGRLRTDWRSLCRDLTRDGPAVVVVEDLQWAEEVLIELLEDVGGGDGGPLMVIATARREGLDRLPAGSALLEVGGLPADEAASLVAELAQAGLADATRDAIVQRADGNPLFLGELARNAAERGAGGDPMLPDTVQAVTAARVDLLEPVQKAAVHAAAVIGRTFWRGAVSELLNGSVPDLAALEKRGLVAAHPRSRLRGEVEYEISHAVIREVAYESIPRASRARLHARFAAWLEARAERPAEHATTLAHHYAEAVRPEHADLAWAHDAPQLATLRRSARRWLRVAASAATARFELSTAIAFLERFLALTPAGDDDEERTEVLGELGRAHALRFDGRAFRHALEDAIRAAPDALRAGELSAELAFQTLVRAGMWNPPPGSDEVETWVREALATDGVSEAGRARALIARGYSDDAKPAAAVAAAVTAADASGDVTLRSYAADLRASRELARGDARAAHQLYVERVALARGISDPDHLADIHMGAIAPALAAGRLASAHAHARELERITRGLSDHHRVHSVAATLEIELMLGDWEAVRALQERVEATVGANVGTPCSLNPRSLLVCAIACLRTGEDAEAGRLERAASEYGLTGFGTVIETPRLRLALLRGEHEAARSLLGRPAIRRTNWVYLWSMATYLDALSILHDARRLELEATPLTATSGYLAPFALRALGVVRGDDSLLATAESRFVQLGLDRHAAATRSVRAGRALV
ncbi:MAG TPA: adenylate/guanylate cyclase domain-containing protein [Miltoncostaeaceae bacterium]|nr:adenylate/guanylate cyclase domain-containing protein [Miltoncostaeaceae bacterium]